MSKSDIPLAIQQIVRQRLRAYDPFKPWAEQSKSERLLFLAFTHALANQGDTIATKFAPAAAYPAMIMSLRRHRREIPHLINEWDIDPENFVAETMRLLQAFEDNVQAAARHHDVQVPASFITRMDREQIEVIVRAFVAAVTNLTPEQIAKWEKGQ